MKRRRFPRFKIPKWLRDNYSSAKNITIRGSEDAITRAEEKRARRRRRNLRNVRRGGYHTSEAATEQIFDIESKDNEA